MRGASRLTGAWRIGLATMLVGLAIALVATRFAAPGVPPWPRFWASAFLLMLLCPVGLSLCRTLAGRGAQLVSACAVLALTAGQHVGIGTVALPIVTSWSVTLASPGDAIRRELTLPNPGDRTWSDAWTRATRVALVVCTEAAVSDSAALRVQLNGRDISSLSAAPRSGRPDARGWYLVPVERFDVDSQRPLVAEVRRDGPVGAPARLCGGQDDSTRPGWRGSARRRNGQWSEDDLADLPIPPIRGRPAPSRYYVELRFFSAEGLPHVGIW